ncbi:MAG: hypothetical protein IPH26_16805 [Sterolibacteriaceae bacterium]|uniref:Transposase n=1 Tax=Candidatus Methylophosphatis roskildensis TaxID=2899263 RepID=A0A9D7E809_9PROT|nr:hypothetical protein [Candidatus Methylophosphatis roskildensis]MBK7236184.1 hypothetical protein [Sterolibacteriaceae bacterium]
MRLCKRYRVLRAKGKKQNKIMTAIARELAGFVWAIAREVSAVASKDGYPQALRSMRAGHLR